MYQLSYRYINKDIKHINKQVKYINKYVKYTNTYLNKTYTFTYIDTLSNIMEAAFGRLHKNGGNPPIFMDSIMLDNVSVYVNVICFI